MVQAYSLIFLRENFREKDGYIYIERERETFNLKRVTGSKKIKTKQSIYFFLLLE